MVNSRDSGHQNFLIFKAERNKIRCDKCGCETIIDPTNHCKVYDEFNDTHLSPTLRTDKRVIQIQKIGDYPINWIFFQL